MAKEAYFGIGDVPKKVKAIYFGVGDVPKKVKFGYFGVGNIPKIFFSAEASTVTFNKTLTNGNAYVDGGGNEFCAMFKGKGSSQGKNISWAYAYNTSLTRSSQLTAQSCQYIGGICGNESYILIGGGLSTSESNSDSPMKTVYSFDSSYTRTSASSLTMSGNSIGTGRLGNYIFFAGGGWNTYSTKVNTYDSSLTQTTNLTLSKSQIRTKCCTLTDCLLVTGGYQSSNANCLAIDAFDSSLTKRSGTLTTSVTNNIIGYNNKYLIADGTTAGTIAIDSSFTQITASALTKAGFAGISAGSSPGVAIFAGAASNNGSSATYYGNVDGFDTSLTKTSITALATKVGFPAIATLNNKYFLLCGGCNDWDENNNAYDYGYTGVQVYNIS